MATGNRVDKVVLLIMARYARPKLQFFAKCHMFDSDGNPAELLPDPPCTATLSIGPSRLSGCMHSVHVVTSDELAAELAKVGTDWALRPLTWSIPAQRPLLCHLVTAIGPLFEKKSRKKTKKKASAGDDDYDVDDMDLPVANPLSIGSKVGRSGSHEPASSGSEEGASPEGSTAVGDHSGEGAAEEDLFGDLAPDELDAMEEELLGDAPDEWADLLEELADSDSVSGVSSGSDGQGDSAAASEEEAGEIEEAVCFAAETAKACNVDILGCISCPVDPLCVKPSSVGSLIFRRRHPLIGGVYSAAVDCIQTAGLLPSHDTSSAMQATSSCSSGYAAVQLSLAQPQSARKSWVCSTRRCSETSLACLDGRLIELGVFALCWVCSPYLCMHCIYVQLQKQVILRR